MSEFGIIGNNAPNFIPTTNLTNLAITNLIEIRQRLKAKFDEETRHFEDRCKPLEEAILKCEGEIIIKMDANGLENVKTEYGTAFFKFPERFNVVDRDIFFGWVLDNRAMDVLTTNLSKDAIKERDIIPPGVEMTKIRKLYIRKPTS